MYYVPLTDAVFESDLRTGCNGSSWPVEITGEHWEAHQPWNPRGEDPSSRYPFKSLKLPIYLDIEVCTSFTYGRTPQKWISERHSDKWSFPAICLWLLICYIYDNPNSTQLLLQLIKMKFIRLSTKFNSDQGALCLWWESTLDKISVHLCCCRKDIN